MHHLEFAAAESAALRPSRAERWLDRAEKLFGMSLDGDQRVDGYSLDGAVDAFKAGMTPEAYVASLHLAPVETA